MARFVRRTTLRVIALPSKSHKGTLRHGTSKSRVRSVPPVRAQATTISATNPEGLKVSSKRDTGITGRKRAASAFSSDTSDSEADVVSSKMLKRFHYHMAKRRDERKKTKVARRESRKISNVTEQLLRERGRWLFSVDRTNIAALDAATQATQKSLRQFQKNLMATSPGEHLFLCLMALPRELRDLIYAAHFADLPSHMVIRPKMGASLIKYPADVQKTLPPFCYINRQLFNESVPVLIQQRTLFLGRSGHKSLRVLLNARSGSRRIEVSHTAQLAASHKLEQHRRHRHRSKR